MRRSTAILVLWCGALVLMAKDASTLSLLFVGDIMGHDTQLEAALQPETGEYEYASCFKYISPLFKSVDYCIANLEVTLAGPPFKGYPEFSSPDVLSKTLKDAGIDVIVTSNNHACDRGTSGAIRTNTILASDTFLHTGTFAGSVDRFQRNPVFLEKNDIRLALLNYTYGTNGLTIKAPASINYIDTTLIYNDVINVQDKVDEVVLFFHWGLEYNALPNISQTALVAFCNRIGVRYIIGSHPHVVQPIVWNKQQTETFVAYSLGNFISNQRTAPRDGGVMVELHFTKNKHGKVELQNAGYHLTWVYNPVIQGRKFFYVLPSAAYENNPSFFIAPSYYSKMMENILSSRTLFQQENKGIEELMK